jgi:hypothetical protein
MLQRDGVVMVKMKVLVLVMMMILMKSSSMTMGLATISPLQEGISSADFCLPESFLSLCVFRPAEAAESMSDPPLVLGFWGRQYTRGGTGRSGPGWPHHWVVWPGASLRHLVVWAPSCSPRSLLLATFIYGVLTVLFPAES